MEELGMIEKVRTPAEVFIPYFDPSHLNDYLRLAAILRAAGIGVEVYPEPKKFGQLQSISQGKTMLRLMYALEEHTETLNGN